MLNNPVLDAFFSMEKEEFENFISNFKYVSKLNDTFKNFSFLYFQKINKNP